MAIPIPTLEGSFILQTNLQGALMISTMDRAISTEFSSALSRSITG
jgi:hypothetical protein